MTLKEIADTIEKKDYLFEILQEGKEFKRKSAPEVLMEYPSLEEYFRKVAKDHRTEKLGILLFVKNGNSFLRKGFFSVPIVAVENAIENSTATVKPAVDDSTKTVEPAIERAVESPHNFLNGNQSMAENTQKQHFHHQTLSKPMDAKAEILQVRLDFANQKVAELERRNKDLERKNDNLFNENTKLLRDNLTQKDKLELEYKQKSLELDSEKKSGLSGIMEEVKTLPPEAWQLIAGIFPNHPMNKTLNGSGKEEEKAEHSDPDARLCIDGIQEALLNQTPETIGMISMLTQAFINNPGALHKVYLKFYPTETPKETKTENL